jgi:hypothetical protein
MKTLLLITTLLIIPGLFASAANAEQEKGFVEKYKAAFEGKDSATLQSVLYTTGADPMIVGFYKMMQSSGAGDKGFQDRAGRSDARRRKEGECAAGFPFRRKSLPQP